MKYWKEPWFIYIFSFQDDMINYVISRVINEVRTDQSQVFKALWSITVEIFEG